MANFNQVTLIGRVVSDPQIRNINDNSKVGNFTIAVNEIYYVDKEKREETSFIDCEIFGKRSEIIEQYATKGREILVNGRLRQNRWEDKTSKEKRSKIVVRVNDFELIGANRGGSQTENKASLPKENGKDNDIPF